MPSGVGVIEVFAELFSKSDRTPFQTTLNSSSYAKERG